MNFYKRIVSMILSLTIVFTTILTIAPKSLAISENGNDFNDNLLAEESNYMLKDNLRELIPGEDFIENEVLIKYQAGSETQSLDSISQELNLNIESYFDSSVYEANTSNTNNNNINYGNGLYLVSTDENDTVLDIVQELSSYDCIEFAQPNYIYNTCEMTNRFNSITENEPKGFQSQQAMLNTLNLGNTNYTGDGVVVAVIDTGIDLSHPALTGCFWSNDGVVGYDTADVNNVVEITMSQDSMYTKDHGTHVAGIIAMQENENFTCKGIAPNVEIMDLQASYEGGSFKTTSIIKALELAEEQGADIVNMSLGGTSFDNALNIACNKAARKMTLIASSGNNGKDREASYPAAFSSVIGVMAYGGSMIASEYENHETITNNSSLLNANYPSNGFMTVAKFSNIDSQNKYYDIVAPGVNICSTKARSQEEKNIVNFNNYDYTFMSGTSMASPIIAGVAALYLEKYPNATPGQIRNALRQDSNKKVKIYDCLNETSNIPSNKFIKNQVDVTSILARIPDAQIDVSYIQNIDNNRVFFNFINEQFGNSFLETDIITNEDMRLISFLQITNFNKIQSFYDKLSEFPNLLDLYISGSSFNNENIKLILENNNFNNLDTLNIQNTEISKIHFSEESMPSIYNLILYKNYGLKELKGLFALSNLSLIDIKYGIIENLDFLSGIESVNDLYITNNKIVDISSISNLLTIKRLLLSDNFITDITPITGLFNLEYVDLSNNYITDISPIETLTNLNILFIENNLIGELGSVLTMPNLHWLYVQNNPLKSKESEIETFFKSKNISDSKLTIFQYKPFKNIVSAENVLAYNSVFKRTELKYIPDIVVFPYNASFAHNVRLSSSNSKIKVNPYSNTLSYNNNYQYNNNDTVFESVINYQCNDIEGSFTANLLMPIIKSVSIEKYSFDSDIQKDYVSILTTTDTTKIKLTQNHLFSTQTYEYNLTSEDVSYYDYENERVIKIKIDDNIRTDRNISVAVGDSIGYFATKVIPNNYQVDIQVVNSKINNISGCADIVFLSSDEIVGINSNSINNNCNIDTLILGNSIANIATNAFDSCDIAELYVINKCSNSNNNVFNNCNDMTVYVSHDSPIANSSEALINSDFKFLCSNNICKLQRYYGSESSVTFPKYLNIKTIGEEAFLQNDSLEEINLSQIINIENRAFKDCRILSNICGVLNLSQIGAEAFKNTHIENITIKSNKNLNSSSVFENCSNLNLASISNNSYSVSIGSRFFKNCRNLNSININSNGTISLYEECFDSCESLENIDFNNISLIGRRVFKNCSNLSGEVIYSGYSIPDESFYNCTNIVSVSLKGSVTLGSLVFYGTTSLREIGLISTNNKCKSNSFNGCNNVVVYINGSSLTNTETGTQFSSNMVNLCTDYKMVLNAYYNIMLTEYSGTDAEICIPECLKIYEIGKEAFYCKGFIRSVYIPDSVNFIDEKAFSMDTNLENLQGGKNVLFIKEMAFYNCKKLKDISSLESILSIGEYSFSWVGIESVSLPQTIMWISECAFFCCKQLKEIELPGRLSYIPVGCFYLCENLERCIIHYKCALIKDSAFYGCTNLKQLYLPSSVSHFEDDSLPQNAVIYCESNVPFISTIRNRFGNTVIPNYEVVNKNLVDYQSITGYDYIDQNNKKVIDVPNVVERIKSSSTFFGGIFENNREAQIYILPDSIKVIDQYSFYESKAEKIIMPSNIQYIGANAFNKCTSLTEISIPNGLKTIENNVFFQTRCTGFRVPDSVTEIKSGAFWHCDKLKSIYIPDNVNNISNTAFADCNDCLVIYGHNNSYLNDFVQNNSNVNGNNNLVYKSGYNISDNILESYDGNDINVQIPYGIGLSEIADEAFINNTLVESISIASGITHIGDNCFKNCTSLTSIIIPDDVEFIGEYAFDGVLGLTVYCNSDSFAEEYCIENNITVVTDYDVSDGILHKYNGSETNVIIPENLSLEEIEGNSFSGNNNVQSIVFPEGVKYIGYNAVSSCRNLTTVTLPTTIRKLDIFAFSYNPMLNTINNSNCIKELGAYVFSNCTSLNNLDLSNIEKLSYYVFNNCSNLTNVKIGIAATSVDYRAFNNCNNITISCYVNSCIYQFAIDNNISYILLSDEADNLSEMNTRNSNSRRSQIRISEENRIDTTENDALDNYIFNVLNGDITEEKIEEIQNYMILNGWWK